MNNKKTCLLDIAEELFCRYGSKGTTMRLITREAGTNTAMLNYYFRSKENLFITVLERRIKKLKKDIKTLSPESNEIIEQLFRLHQCLYRSYYRESSLLQANDGGKTSQ
jgi:AcrR family transcriptional regulator